MTPVKHVGRLRRTISLEKDTFDSHDPRMKEDIVRIVIQYLQDEGYTASMMTLQDEANVKAGEHEARRRQMRRMKKLIMEGDWQEVEKLSSKSISKEYKHEKGFLYAVYKQQFLELIERQESQKAFTFLSKRIKPLEGGSQTDPGEFSDLCYLLTCKSVQDAASFKDWDVTSSRLKLSEEFATMVEADAMHSRTQDTGPAPVPSQRLVTLLQQAVGYQIEFNRYHPQATPNVTTLLEDYKSFVLPNQTMHTLVGHQGNVKCVQFMGEEGNYIATGSSDNTVMVWDVAEGERLLTLRGHHSRIWDLSSTNNHDRLLSASGDSTVKIWNTSSLENETEKGNEEPVHTYTGHDGDIYSVEYHPRQTHFVTGGYDKTLQLFDTVTGQVVKKFTGHTSAVSRALFNPHGNLIVSGSKDCTIRFWDIVSGACVNTLSSHLGEVTSVELNSSGQYLLSSSKDNSNRLWDVRMSRPLRKFKGHQNTSRNFVRACFGTNGQCVIGGSEDGMVYIWDLESCSVLKKLYGHQGIVYHTAWSQYQSLLVSCSDDNTAKLWWYDELGTGSER